MMEQTKVMITKSLADITEMWGAINSRLTEASDEKPGTPYNISADLEHCETTSLTNMLLTLTFTLNTTSHVLAYKKVTKSILPVPTMVLESAKIHRRFPENPLDSLPQLSPLPVEFTPRAYR